SRTSRGPAGGPRLHAGPASWRSTTASRTAPRHRHRLSRHHYALETRAIRQRRASVLHHGDHCTTMAVTAPGSLVGAELAGEPTGLGPQLLLARPPDRRPPSTTPLYATTTKRLVP